MVAQGPDVRRLGLAPYARTSDLQASAAEHLRRDPKARETVFVLQHPPVITLGRHADRSHVRLDDGALAAVGLHVVQTDRGGDATVHSPGQIVVYPILHLGRRRLGPARLVELLEEAMIDTCRSFGVPTSRNPPHAGVWVERPRVPCGPAKIGAVGLRVSGGVSTHGIALNVDNDLSLFDAIVPCGIPGAAVTSLRVETGREVDVQAVEDALVWALRTELGEIERLAPVANRETGPV